MSDKVQVSGGGVGFLGLLTILFIGLKLGGVINWPWLWVLAPLWVIPFTLITAGLVVVVLAFLVGIIIGVIQHFTK